MRSSNQDVVSEALRQFRLPTFTRGCWGHICMFPSPPAHAHCVTVTPLQQDGRRSLCSVRPTEWLHCWLWLACLLSISWREGSSPATAQCQQATPRCRGHKVFNSHTHTHRVTGYTHACTCVWAAEGQGAAAAGDADSKTEARVSAGMYKSTTCTQTVNKQAFPWRCATTPSKYTGREAENRNKQDKWRQSIIPSLPLYPSPDEVKTPANVGIWWNTPQHSRK